MSERPDEPAPAPAPPDRELEVASTLARWMDQRFLDPLLGLLLPGVGDLLSAGLGLYPVMLAWQRRAPKTLVARMLLNLAADAAGGAIPIIGDVWDFLFRAHARNLDLLKARARGAGEVKGHWSDVLLIVGALLVLLASLALPVLAAVWLWRVLERIS